MERTFDGSRPAYAADRRPAGVKLVQTAPVRAPATFSPPVTSPLHEMQRYAGIGLAQRILPLAVASGPQPTLAVSAAGDPIEREADRVADQVMRMRDGEAWSGMLERIPAESRSSGALTADLAPLGSGQPLAPSVRAFFEPRLASDLSDVRLHTDRQADLSARSLGALAFTFDRHIAFRSGQYAPESSSGRRLLAHELAHVAANQRCPIVAIARQAEGSGTPTSTMAAQDWEAMADRMSLRKLEATVLQLRDEITEATQSSAEHASLAQELRVFERALGRRQLGGIALASATAASRRHVRTSIATTRGDIFAVAKASIELHLTAGSLFWQGVYTGSVGEIPPGKVRDFLTDVQENWRELDIGYNVGLVQGLWHGVVNLVDGLALLARLAFWASPGGTALELGRMIHDPQAYFAARQAEHERMQKLIAAVRRFWAEFEADPTIVLQWSSELGVAIGEGLGAKIGSFMDEPAYEKGRDIGDVVGQVLFEVLLGILLAVATAGIGNAIRAGAAGGEVAARSGRLALAIRRAMEASPAVRRLVMEFAGHAELASDMARAGRGLEQAPAAARGLAGTGETVGAVRTAETTAEAGRVAKTGHAVEATRAAETPGTQISRAGAANIDPATRAKVVAHQSRIRQFGEEAAAARETERELPEIIRVLQENRRADGRINLQALSPDQQETLSQVFHQLDEEALSRLTLRDIRDASGKSGAEARRLYEKQEAEIEELRFDMRPLLERLHDATPQRQIDQALKRAGKLDEFSGLAPPSGELDVDHVVPLRRIVDDVPGFAELDWADQAAIANDPANLRAIDRSANRARGDTLWSEWDGRYPNGRYDLAALRRASQQEETALGVIKERIKERLSAEGLRPALR